MSMPSRAELVTELFEMSDALRIKGGTKRALLPSIALGWYKDRMGDMPDKMVHKELRIVSKILRESQSHLDSVQTDAKTFQDRLRAGKIERSYELNFSSRHGGLSAPFDTIKSATKGISEIRHQVSLTKSELFEMQNKFSQVWALLGTPSLHRVHELEWRKGEIEELTQERLEAKNVAVNLVRSMSLA